MRESGAILPCNLRGCEDRDAAFTERMVKGANIDARPNGGVGQHKIELLDSKLCKQSLVPIYMYR